MENIIYFDFNHKSSVLLIFFFNAITFSFLLLKESIRTNHKPAKWLAVFTFLGGLYICPFMLGYANWYSIKSYREFLFFAPLQQLFLIGPVFFFYVKTLLDKSFRLTRKDLIHFLPALGYLAYSIIIFIVDKLILDEFYFYADGRDKDLDFWYQMAGLISMLFYLLGSLRYYIKYRKLSLQEVSFADKIAFKWIKNFIISFGLILVLRVLFFILNPEWGEFGSKYWYYLCFSILLLYITITGYSNTIRTDLKLYAKPMVTFELLGEDENDDFNNGFEDDTLLAEWKNKITHLFEVEEIHKNPNLTLTNLASLLNTNRNIVSRIINQEFKMNFNDFVNERRAKLMIEKLKNGEHAHSTLLGIALDCGFNSKTTFNRAFKKCTGITPKQFILKNRL